ENQKERLENKEAHNRRSERSGRTPKKPGESDAKKVTTSRKQKPTKLVLNEPPLSGDRAGRPSSKRKMRRWSQKPI
ncbi:unnamed protein product, partial [Brassica rapa]